MILFQAHQVLTASGAAAVLEAVFRFTSHTRIVGTSVSFDQELGLRSIALQQTGCTFE